MYMKEKVQHDRTSYRVVLVSFPHRYSSIGGFANDRWKRHNLDSSQNEQTHIHNSLELLSESDLCKLSEKFFQFEKQLKSLAAVHLLKCNESKCNIEQVQIEMKQQKESASFIG